MERELFGGIARHGAMRGREGGGYNPCQCFHSLAGLLAYWHHTGSRPGKPAVQCLCAVLCSVPCLCTGPSQPRGPASQPSYPPSRPPAAAPVVNKNSKAMLRTIAPYGLYPRSMHDDMRMIGCTHVLGMASGGADLRWNWPSMKIPFFPLHFR